MTFQPTTPEALLDAAKQTSRLLWILDGGLEPDLETIVTQLDYRIWRDWIYNQTEYEAEFQKGPLLVEACSDTPLLEAFVESWAPLHWGGLLISSHPFEVVLQHLRALRHAQLPDGSLALLRLHEPRALRGFAQGMDSDALDHLLGPIDHWHWCEWNAGHGDWYQLAHSSPRHGAIAHCPLMLSTAHVRALENQREDYRNKGFARRLRMSGIPALDNMDEPALLGYVQIQATHAVLRGFDNDEDLMDYLDIYFRYHRAIFEPDSRLADILDDAGVPTWRRLRQARALMAGGEA